MKGHGCSVLSLCPYIPEASPPKEGCGFFELILKVLKDEVRGYRYYVI